GREQPPLTAIEHFTERVVLEGDLALVYEQPRLRPTRGDLLRDLREGELAVGEVAEDEAKREEGGGVRPGHDDLRSRKLLAGDRLPRDDDRAVPRADARAVRQERVVLLHERIGG